MEIFDHMKTIEDDFGVGTPFFKGRDVRATHINTNSLYLTTATRTQSLEKSVQILLPTTISDPNHSRSQGIDNHSDIVVPFSLRDLVTSKLFEAFETGLVWLEFLKSLLFKAVNCVLTDTIIESDVRSGRITGQFD